MSSLCFQISVNVIKNAHNDNMSHPTPSTSLPDERPRTVVLQQFAGIGDLIWHIPYFREIARKSKNGKVSLIARPSTLARDILAYEEWVEQIIYYDNTTRSQDRRKKKHGGLGGMFRMARELREYKFDRIILFSPRVNRVLLAILAKIPHRLGYGFHWFQRLFLTEGPFIKPYKGPSLAVYRDVSSFAIALGLCTKPIVPKLRVPPEIENKVRQKLAALPPSFYTFAIGTSEPSKQWGAAKFSKLATRLLEKGHGVLLVGGPGEEKLALEIEKSIPSALRHNIGHFTQEHILDSAAAIKISLACIGNDTGAINMSAACDRPAFVLLGDRQPIDHDPLLHILAAPTLDIISVDDVMQRLAEAGMLAAI